MQKPISFNQQCNWWYDNFNCGFKFQKNTTHIYACRHYKAILSTARQSSSAVGIGQFCYTRIIAKSKMLSIANSNKFQQNALTVAK